MATEVSVLFFMTQGNLINCQDLNYRRLASSILLNFWRRNYFFLILIHLENKM